jgi:hypothetical protein
MISEGGNMAVISPNIVDLVKGYLTGDVKNRISSFLGESSDKTQSGIDAAVPGLLSGFTSAASTPDGAQRLASAVDKGDDGILSNLSSILGKGYSADTGSGLLQSILGAGGLSELTGRIGKSSGLSGSATSALLSFLAPVAIGALKKLKLSGGLDAAGLSSLLASQKNNIAAAMPEGMREDVHEPAEESYRAPRAIHQPIRPEVYGTPRMEHHRSSAGWILPLLALLILGGLIWRWATVHSVRAAREQSVATEQSRNAQQTQVSLNMLEAKYKSVIDTAQANGVQISSMTSQDGKLMISGTAPSTEAANKVWDEIKRVNRSMNDIVAFFSVNNP